MAGSWSKSLVASTESVKIPLQAAAMTRRVARPRPDCRPAEKVVNPWLAEWAQLRPGIRRRWLGRRGVVLVPSLVSGQLGPTRPMRIGVHAMLISHCRVERRAPESAQSFRRSLRHRTARRRSNPAEIILDRPVVGGDPNPTTENWKEELS